MQADNAAADDKIFRRQAALQALVNRLPKEPAQLTPWEAYKGLLSDPKAVLRRVSAAGMAYRNTKGQNSLIGTRMEAAAEKGSGRSLPYAAGSGYSEA